MRITYKIDEAHYFTKKGVISRRAMDLTNVEKPLVDLLFDPRFEERGEVINLCMDDKFITKLLSEKVPSKGWEIVIELEIKDINNEDK